MLGVRRSPSQQGRHPQARTPAWVEPGPRCRHRRPRTQPHTPCAACPMGRGRQGPRLTGRNAPRRMRRRTTRKSLSLWLLPCLQVLPGGFTKTRPSPTAQGRRRGRLFTVSAPGPRGGGWGPALLLRGRGPGAGALLLFMFWKDDMPLGTKFRRNGKPQCALEGSCHWLLAAPPGPLSNTETTVGCTPGPWAPLSSLHTGSWRFRVRLWSRSSTALRADAPGVWPAHGTLAVPEFG